MQTPLEQQVLDFTLHVAALVKPLNDRIAKRDRRLGHQLLESSSSFVLNVAEGFGTEGGHKRERFSTAYGSTKEAHVTLRLAVVRGYLDRDSTADALMALDRLAARIYGLKRS